MGLTTPRHGQICLQSGYLLRRFFEDHDLGHVVSNDAGLITERGPDTVRARTSPSTATIASPRDPCRRNTAAKPPELIIEVLSASDRWSKVHAKVTEYLEAGVLAVVVLDDDSRTAFLFRPDQGPRILGPDEEFAIPEILPGFSVPVRRFFE